MKMSMRIIVLTEEQLLKLPFPVTARTLGGLLVAEEEALMNHLNVEEFRRQWNETIKSSEFKTPVFETECSHVWSHYEEDMCETCRLCSVQGERAAK